MLDPADDMLLQLRRVVPAGPHQDRRLGRCLAFQALYERDLTQHPPEPLLDRWLARTEHVPLADDWSPTVLQQARAYAQRIINGVLEHQEGIDALIQERASLWPLAQMSAVDRNVLRIGLYESLFGNAKVPLRTAINEAVELAKLFGSEASPRFVNGVLGRAAEQHAASIGAGAAQTATCSPGSEHDSDSDPSASEP